MEILSAYRNTVLTPGPESRTVTFFDFFENFRQNTPKNTTIRVNIHGLLHFFGHFFVTVLAKIEILAECQNVGK